MATETKKLYTSTTPQPSSQTGIHRPCVVLIEDNPLTTWAIEQALASSFDLLLCTKIEEAEKELACPEDCYFIIGSPIADEHPEQVIQLAKLAPDRVVALVSDPDNLIPNKSIRVLEKPFELSHLINLLKEATQHNSDLPKEVMIVYPNEDNPTTGSLAGPLPLEVRLRDRFEREVCPVCIHRTADGGCSITNRLDHFNCPVFEWADKIATLVRHVESPRLEDYLDQIQSIICPDCKQTPNGRCKTRDHLDCPIDLYLGLVIPIVEEELSAGRPT